MNCPVCDGVRMREVDKDDVQIDICPQCKGVWLDRGELDKLLSGVQEIRDDFNKWEQERYGGESRDAGKDVPRDPSRDIPRDAPRDYPRDLPRDYSSDSQRGYQGTQKGYPGDSQRDYPRDYGRERDSDHRQYPGKHHDPYYGKKRKKNLLDRLGDIFD
ncbi:hypothetical protein EBB07_04895 [Paenibacillaceae bacterium]|nr:hypothetical protein EBB07_04895 [Paenibacillaceae bacterium]